MNASTIPAATMIVAFGRENTSAVCADCATRMFIRFPNGAIANVGTPAAGVQCESFEHLKDAVLAS